MNYRITSRDADAYIEVVNKKRKFYVQCLCVCIIVLFKRIPRYSLLSLFS